MNDSRVNGSFVPPHTDFSMPVWSPTQKDLKQYRHFDHPMPLGEIVPFVSNPLLVASHSFMPLLHFEKTWRRAPIKEKGKKPIPRKPKSRPIRYASRKDAYIFKHYRELLTDSYEARLVAAGLQDSILAYRRIEKGGGHGGHKSNIEFARDAFDAVKKLGRCCAVAIDISDFFGSMSHTRIKTVWSELLGVPHLPDDHFAVFKALTRYRYVVRDEAYVALGHSRVGKKGELSFTRDPNSIPLQICSNDQFRELIVKGGLVKKHTDPYGVPQGAPLSDLIANAYLFDFDVLMKQYAEAKGGYYFRYSDDILFVLPGDGRTALSAFKFASRSITSMGDMLQIKPEKTEITCYTGAATGDRCYALAYEGAGKKSTKKSPNDGLSYLGFRYDGERVFIRNSTISNVRGKMSRSSRATALNHVDRYLSKDLDWLLKNSPLDQLTTKFFQVEKFEESIAEAKGAGDSPFGKMTFFTYAKRAAEAFGDRGRPISKQTMKLKRQLRSMLDREIIAKFQTRDGRLHHKVA